MPYTSWIGGAGLSAGAVLIPGGGPFGQIARILMLVTGAVFGLYAIAMIGLAVWGRLTPQVTEDREIVRWTSPSR